MDLTADRLIVVVGERIHAVAVVQSSLLAVAAQGGIGHLLHALEDVGFFDVVIHTTPPALWSLERRAMPATPDLTWPIWIEATPSRSASYRRELTEEITIATAWDAREDARASAGLYTMRPNEPQRLVGYVALYGVAYPLFVAGVA